MKITILKPCERGDFSRYKKLRLGLPQNIFSLAATTPKWVEVELIDEGIDEVGYDTDADLVAMMFSSPDALRAYEHAKGFRKRGKTVVMGGLHPTFMPQEAIQYADAVLVGEAEGVWENLLADFKVNALERVYRAKKPVNLAELKPFPTDLIPAAKYEWVWTVVVSRGCPFRCEFCTVHRFFPSIRYRPIKRVIHEIESCPCDYIELKADNLIVDRKYCLELFKALRPLGIRWSTSADIRFAADEELLDAAAESGLHYILLGIETPSDQALRKAGKGFVRPEEAYEYVSRFHKYGIIVDAAALFGFDEHKPDIFERTLTFFDNIEVDVCDPAIVVPFPGTALFDRLQSEGRISTYDWRKYDGSHAVFSPLHMTAEDLEWGAYWFYEQWHDEKRRTKRHARQLRQIGAEDAHWINSNFERGA